MSINGITTTGSTLSYSDCTSTAATGDCWVRVNGSAYYDGNISFSVDKKNSISPVIYFKYIKKKFNIIERLKVEGRLKKLEKAFNQAVENGQDALAEKFLNEVAINVKETELYAKGFKLWISKEDLNKHKNNIQNGHISDTALEDYTRVIPADVAKKIKEVSGIFDSMVIYHYWNPEEEKKIKKKQKMDSNEVSKMRDPVVFGRIKEASDRLYFIADWEDEYCTLTFDEIIDVVSAKEVTNKIVAEKI